MGRTTSKGNEAPFRYASAEIRTQVVVICGPTRYQLDYGGARSDLNVGARALWPTALPIMQFLPFDDCTCL